MEGVHIVHYKNGLVVALDGRKIIGYASTPWKRNELITKIAKKYGFDIRVKIESMEGYMYLWEYYMFLNGDLPTIPDSITDDSQEECND